MSIIRRLLSFALLQMLIEVIAFLVLVLVLQQLFRFLPANLFGNIISNTLAAIVAICLLVIAARWLEHRSLAEVGLPFRHFGRNLLFGILLGACLIASIIGVMALAGYYRITSMGQISTNVGFLFAFLLIFLAGAVQEEILFRGIIFRLVERALGSWIAVLLSAILFGVAHLATPHATAVSALAIVLTAGITGAALYILTRSLWWVIGFHFGWNFFEGPIFGAQVSGSTTQTLFHGVISGPSVWTGGAFGPEAGLVAIIIVGGIGLILLVVAARQGQIITPSFLRRARQVEQTEITPAGS